MSLLLSVSLPPSLSASQLVWVLKCKKNKKKKQFLFAVCVVLFISSSPTPPPFFFSSQYTPSPDSAHPRATHTSSYRVSGSAPPVTLSLHHAHFSQLSRTCEQLTSPVEQNAADKALVSHHCLCKPQTASINTIIVNFQRLTGARGQFLMSNLK